VAFEGLREQIQKLGYRLIRTLTPDTAGADGLLKPTDVIIVGDQHSGFVNRAKKVDHFIQPRGAPGTEFTGEAAMRTPNFKRGWTLSAIWGYGYTFTDFTDGAATTRVLSPYRNSNIEIWRRSADLNVTVTWNTATDVDLWVIEPDNTKCYYGHLRTRNGGHLLQDVTAGFGPEEYQLPKAVPGEYVVKVHLYSRPANAPAATTVTVVVTRNAGTPTATSQTYTVTLRNRGDLVEVCRVRL